MIYFIGAGGQFVKIGVTKDQVVSKRLKQLQTACPLPLTVLGVITSGGYFEEGMLHAQFARYAVGGEWFRLSEEIFEYIDKNAIKFSASPPPFLPTREARNPKARLCRNPWPRRMAGDKISLPSQ